MIFSAGLKERDFGQAIVIPCKSQDLIEEAVRLWTAETRCGKNPKERISATWGCVGLLENPHHPMPDGIRKDWIAKVHDERNYGELQSARGEQPAVAKNGFLNISWPKAVDGSGLELDVILATATDPTLDNREYFSVKEIAKAWKSGSGKEEVYYFRDNIISKITTFEDKRICKLLNDGQSID